MPPASREGSGRPVDVLISRQPHSRAGHRWLAAWQAGRTTAPLLHRALSVVSVPVLLISSPTLAGRRAGTRDHRPKLW